MNEGETRAEHIAFAAEGKSLIADYVQEYRGTKRITVDATT
jgi:hypothetical protein